jgi:hypothetical protein
MAGIGLPVNELTAEERVEFVQMVLSALPSFSVNEMARTVDNSTLSELKAALTVAGEAIEAIPPKMRSLIPADIVEMIQALITPAVIQAQKTMELEWTTRPS